MTPGNKDDSKMAHYATYIRASTDTQETVHQRDAINGGSTNTMSSRTTLTATPTSAIPGPILVANSSPS